MIDGMWQRLIWIFFLVLEELVGGIWGYSFIRNIEVYVFRCYLNIYKQVDVVLEEGKKDVINYFNFGYYLDNLDNVVWYFKGQIFFIVNLILVFQGIDNFYLNYFYKLNFYFY